MIGQVKLDQDQWTYTTLTLYNVSLCILLADCAAGAGWEELTVQEVYKEMFRF